MLSGFDRVRSRPTIARGSADWQGSIWFPSLLVCSLLALHAGCRGSSESSGDKADASNSTSSASTSDASSSGDSKSSAGLAEEPPLDALPDGNAEELFAFLRTSEEKELGPEDSDADSPDSGGEAAEPAKDQGPVLRKLMRTRVAVCDKILSKQVPDETQMRALGIKLDALRTLTALDSDRYKAPFLALVDQLSKSGNPLMARMAKATQFQSRVNEYLSFGKESPDVVLGELKTLLSDDQVGPETLDATRDAMGWIFQSGNVDMAASGFRMIGEKFQDNADENLSGEGRSLVSQAMRIQLTQISREVADGKEGSLDRLREALGTLLQPEKLDPNVLGYAMQTAQFLEFYGHPSESLKAYDQIQARFANDSDQNIVATIGHTIDLARKRLTLVGAPIQLEGVTLGGDAFDWSKYQGKWVVVVFWTTWQQNILEEIDRIRDAVRESESESIEVVMVNLDDDRNALERFLKEHPIGWKILVQADPNAAGFENPNALRCGVEAVPFVLLVDTEGKVSEIHLMGDRLKKALAAKMPKK